MRQSNRHRTSRRSVSSSSRRPVTPSRASTRASHGRTPVSRRPKKRRFTGVVVACLLVLVCAGSAWAYYGIVSGNLHAGLDDSLENALVKTDLTNEPFYMLLMGIDSSSEREGTDETSRSDSIILARVDPKDKKVTMVSIHRDTLVDMGEYGQNKLNAAHALGGPALMVETVSELAGVPISHYAEINFDGFKEVVDVLGGVEVDVPREIDDDAAGGHLDAGEQTLSGDQALILCRSRHAYDDLGGGDSYRAANQRLVLGAIAKKVLASDPATMASTVQALSKYVTTDLEITDIVGLAQAMQGLDPATDIYSAMEPTTSSYINGVWYEINDIEAWQTMMSRVDQGLPPTEEDVIDETSGTILASTGSGKLSSKEKKSSSSPKRSGLVALRNGNGIAGVCTEASESLEKLGYTVEAGNADSFDYSQTLVVYINADQAEEAQEIADKLGVGTVMQNDGSYLFEEDFLVVLGLDWS